jgi:hypothetical protein
VDARDKRGHDGRELAASRSPDALYGYESSFFVPQLCVIVAAVSSGYP